MSRDGTVQFDAVTARHPGVSRCPDFYVFQISPADFLKMHVNADASDINFPREDGNDNGNSIESLHGGEDIANDRPVCAHDLPDVFPMRYVGTCDSLIDGDRIYDLSLRIHPRYTKYLSFVFMVNIPKYLFSFIIENNDTVVLRNNFQMAEPVMEVFFNSPGRLGGMNLLSAVQFINSLLFCIHIKVIKHVEAYAEKRKYGCKWIMFFHKQPPKTKGNRKGRLRNRILLKTFVL